ncbi:MULTISPECIES: aminoglycoside phosphotransferase family protein [Actinoplanes]|uniref:aminoglycoside phosphotransferase family protein n=1 Tax=Actinoplanes TaxID=1865 RepID=UPI0005F2A36B|nr:MULTISPECIES: aminoglycoside phosphotransferase family protein [Actinoplanes]GLY02487.1 putative phosphotransferase [Actinoplanes sp. NBRC 101535]
MQITEQTVRNLIAAQFPAWADLPVRQVRSAGTVNAIFRVGESLVARLPLAEGEDLHAEGYAAQQLLGRTRFVTPTPVAVGEPGPGFPRPWSVQTWLPGTIATDDDPGASTGFAEDLAELILGMRAVDTGGRAFDGRGRGGVIADQGEWMQTCFANSERLLPVHHLRCLWDALGDLPRGPDPDVMSHKDLMPGNVLVAGGRLAGVLDVGGFGPADPALDLVGAWHLLESGPREVLRERLGCGDAEWDRGRAWAFAQSMGLVWYYATTNPTMSRIGRRTLMRLLGGYPSAV